MTYFSYILFQMINEMHGNILLSMHLNEFKCFCVIVKEQEISMNITLKENYVAGNINSLTDIQKGKNVMLFSLHVLKNVYKKRFLSILLKF